MTAFVDFLGLMGSLAFAVCSWPQAYQALKTKSAKEIKWSFILCWLFASIFSAIYAIGIQKYMLLPNYVAGGLGILVVGIVKLFEAKAKKNAFF